MRVGMYWSRGWLNGGGVGIGGRERLEGGRELLAVMAWEIRLGRWESDSRYPVFFRYIDLRQYR